MKTSTCRYKAWTIGRVWPGITREASRRFGYFPGRPLSAELPLLFLVAPSLRVHPATDTLLRYISPEIQWTLVGLDERWRNGVRVVFRKRPGQPPKSTEKTDFPKAG
jgi:hypothetical protein